MRISGNVIPMCFVLIMLVIGYSSACSLSDFGSFTCSGSLSLTTVNGVCTCTCNGASCSSLTTSTATTTMSTKANNQLNLKANSLLFYSSIITLIFLILWENPYTCA